MLARTDAAMAMPALRATNASRHERNPPETG